MSSDGLKDNGHHYPIYAITWFYMSYLVDVTETGRYDFKETLKQL